MDIFQDKSSENSYADYSISENAKIEQDLIFEKLVSLLPKNPEIKILDAACGNGWLAGRLSQTYKDIHGFDLSPALIESAKKKFPEVDFQTKNLLNSLPYEANTFDVVLFIMAAHDAEDLKTAINNLSGVLKPGGQMLMAVSNPYYSFPVGVWKRGIKKLLPWAKPELKLRSYNKIKKSPDKSFIWNKNITSYFYTLPEYINTSLNARLELKSLTEVSSNVDGDKFNRQYQLYRFPLILLLEFKKLSK